MKTLKTALFIIVIGSVLAIATLAYSRQDTTGCDAPNNPFAGATYCQAYGPTDVYGWPRPLKKISESIKYNKELVDHYKADNRRAFLTNLVLFNVAIAVTSTGLYYFKRIQHAHFRH